MILLFLGIAIGIPIGAAIMALKMGVMG